MNQLDILFWLLIALMAGIGWAIEAGLAYRHRKLLACSTLSSLAAVLFIMFWIEDNSQFVFSKPPPIVKVKRAGGDRGGFEVVEKEEKGSGAKSADPSAPPDDEQQPENVADSAGDPNELTSDYNRDPFLDCTNCPEMVIVPGGTFKQGSPLTEPGRAAGEQTPTLIPMSKAFAIGRLEVLRGEYAHFVDQTRRKPSLCDIGRRSSIKYNWQRPGFEQDDSHPVVCVSWDDASAYVAWLSMKTGRSYRLATEAEWEYAARAGTELAYSTGASVVRSQANFAKTRDGTIAAGLTPPNAFGLSGVMGNAAEMTVDCADRTPVSGALRAGADAADCKRYIVKGGAWNSSKPALRSAARSAIASDAVNNFTGFRVVRDLDERDDEKRLTRGQKKAIAAAETLAREIEAKQQAEAAKAAKEAQAAKDAKEAEKAQKGK